MIMYVLRFVALVTLLSASLLRFGAVARTVADLEKVADLIVVGSSGAQTQSGRTFFFSITVERALKGNAAPGTIIPTRWEMNHDAHVGTVTRQLRGIWFLRDTRSGTWEAVTARSVAAETFIWQALYPASRQPLPPELAYAASADVLDKLVLEIGAVSVQAVSGQETETFHRERAAFGEAVGMLDSPAVRKVVDYMVQSGDPR